MQRTTLFVCLSTFICAALAHSQDQSSAAPQSSATSAKAKPDAAEPEAGTNEGTEALQKATQNPVASLISVPVQNNNNFGVNPGYRNQDFLNIQPVIPIGISKDWNLIIRWIAPIIYQPLPNQPGTHETGVYGLGDMQPTFFLSPRKPGKIIWGAGPIFQLLPLQTTISVRVNSVSGHPLSCSHNPDIGPWAHLQTTYGRWLARAAVPR